MKILILQDDFPPLSIGGAGMVAFSQAKALSKVGHEVMVISAVEDSESEGLIEYGGLKIFRVFSRYHERWRAYVGLYNPMVIHKISKIMREFSPDIVHAHNIHTHLSYASLKVGKLSGAKVFLTAHDVMSFHYGKMNGDRVTTWTQIKKYTKRYNPFRNFVIRKYFKYVDRIFAVSRALEEVLIKHGISKVSVINNGIDIRDWQIDQSVIINFRNKHGLNGKKVILFGGRLSAQKGAEEILKIMEKLVINIPNMILLVVGKENAYAESLRERAQLSGIGDRLLFTGWIEGEELRAAYGASDIVTVLSVYLDPFPTIVLEAMASKKPVVATKFGGSKEMVLDGVTGYVVDPFNLKECVEKFCQLLTNESRSIAFGRAGYERVQNKFSINEQTNVLIKAYLDTPSKR